jgi:hypothetical protein
MRVDKIILRAVLSTVAAMLILFAFMILALTFLYPSTMMLISYDLGLENASINCAARAYGYSNEVYYIAYATEVAIGADNDEKIVLCGDKLLGDKNFETYCVERNAALPDGVKGDYEQYVYGQICTAKYRLGDKTGAVDLAFQSLEENKFPENNAAAAVLLVALGNEGKSGATVNAIKTKMNEMTNTLQGDRTYFDGIFALLNE